MPRTLTALTAVVIVVCGLGVRALWDGPVPKYAGDALYTAMIYAVAVFALPRLRPRAAAAVSCGLSWIIEFAQLGTIPEVLRPVLGSTFNPPDLLWYAVGAVACLAAHAAWLSSRHRLRAEDAEQG
ncbi:DUF2809 domain-containing protein [Nonomuraea candida]|uniref:ribosomal maturation YjgA family protein n=1 Tax=Nonomuraea candida TaxID=359159 RepID=UPI0007C77216|nr:DUF2809 domain-containing protein [Nonomuraea candida]